MAQFFLSNTGLSCLYHKSERKVNFLKASTGIKSVLLSTFYLNFSVPSFTAITATLSFFLIFIQKEQTTLECIKLPTARLTLNAANGECEDIMQPFF